MPQRKKPPPPTAPVERISRARVQGIRDLANDLERATQDSQAVAKTAREQFDAIAAGPLLGKGKTNR
jgi:hypothetical protein